MKTIKLPCFGIILDVDENTPGGGTITSNLYPESPMDEDDVAQTAAYDAIESLILAHAGAGIDVESPAYIQGIETAVFALGNT